MNKCNDMICFHIKEINMGGYVVSFPDLPGCLSVSEATDEAVANV